MLRQYETRRYQMPQEEIKALVREKRAELVRQQLLIKGASGFCVSGRLGSFRQRHLNWQFNRRFRSEVFPCEKNECAD